MDRVCGMPQRARVTIGADASESVRGCQLDSYSRLLSLLAAYYGAYKPIYMPRRVRYTNLLFYEAACTLQLTRACVPQLWPVRTAASATGL